MTSNHFESEMATVVSIVCILFGIIFPLVSAFTAQCTAPLGMESGLIKDAQITSSSQYDGNHAAIQGRLNFKKHGSKRGGWSARRNDGSQWIQVALPTYTEITQVSTQGRNGANQWVTKYKLQYSDDGVTFYYYHEAGQSSPEEFIGNQDRDTIVSNKLDPPIHTRFVRIVPTAWDGHVSLRMELYGCKDDEDRIIMFKEPIPNKVMKGHVISSEEVPNEGSCRVLCYTEPDCVSINVRPLEGGNYKCELNNVTDENKLTFIDESVTYLSIENPCSSSPCLSGRTCQVGFTSRGFRCVCPPGFSGANCERAKSCSHLKKLNSTAVNGTYVIDPDGEGGLPPLYNVTCDMSDKNGVGVTVISHDSENKTLVDGCDFRGCYSRDIHYTGADLTQLAGLTNVSSHCEQFIKYDCFGSVMFLSNDSDRYHAWWVSRDSAKMTYWGGADPGSGKCACGMNNSCANPQHACNCDKNDKNWREDSGLLTDKTHLPVKQLRFGDIGYWYVDEKGYHTLGKFKCYGIALL